MTVITRDTFGMAMKATYGEFGDKKLFIYKDPKTDDGNLKKSHKGCCQVIRCPSGEFACYDECEGRVDDINTDLETVFINGELTRYENFMGIRRRMYGEN
jgi:nicotinamide phosphoribosyltransferase